MLKKINNTFLSLIFQSINLRKKFKFTKSIEEFVGNNNVYFDKKSVGLDLGCGVNPRNLFNVNNMYGVDIRSNNIKIVKEANLSLDQIPFQDNTFDFCTAFDFIEHIPRQIYIKDKLKLPFVNLMNEIYRVLKPNGIFLHSTPAFPSKQAFQDPTHINFITEDTFPHYFCSNINNKTSMEGVKNNAIASIYDFKGNFLHLDQAWLYNGVNIVGLLKAKK